MSSWFSELNYAIRVLLKQRAFSAMAIAILAIAIGANTAIFPLCERGCWTRFHIPTRRGLAGLARRDKVGFPKNTPAPGDYADWKSQNTVFAGMAA